MIDTLRFTKNTTDLGYFARCVLLVFLSFSLSKSNSQTILLSKQVFNYTGTDQSLTIPPCAKQIKVKAWGAGGGGSYYQFESSGGGAGGYAEGTFTVTPGDVFSVMVGEGGPCDGNFDVVSYGFGGVQLTTDYGGGGGGLSGLFTGAGPILQTDQARALLVAGGGGGGEKEATPSRCSSGGQGGDAIFGGGMPDMQGESNFLSGGCGGGGYNGGLMTFRLSGSGIDYAGEGGTNYLAPAVIGGISSSSPDFGTWNVFPQMFQNPPNTADPDYSPWVSSVNPGIGTGSMYTFLRSGNGRVVIEIYADPYLIPSVTIAPTTPVLCLGASATFTATPTNGGTTPAYQWQVNGINVGGPSGPTFTSSTLNNGDNIGVIMTSSEICVSPQTDNDLVNITVNTPPTANAGTDVSICSGSSTGLNASGGTSYSWTPSTNLSNAVVSNPVANPASPTTYTVTVTDVNGCTDTDEINVEVNPLPVASAGNNVIICPGESATLNASGGTGYLWAPATNLSNATISNPVANPAADIIYTVTVTDANGCTNTATLTITVTSTLVANAGSDVSLCSGSSATLSASGGSTYSWSPSTGLSNPNIANPIANPASPITYTVVVSSGNCSSVDMVSVNVNQLPVANAGTDVSICSGSSVGLNASGATSYVWTPSTNLSNAAVSNPVANPVSPTTYTVTVTDGNGCTGTDAINVEVNPLPVANAGTDVSICSGSSTGLNASGGTSYSWTPSTNLSNAVVSNPVANPASPTTYTVTVTDVNGCTDTDEINVEVNSLPVASAGSNVILCPGESATLNASGGTGYLWTPATNLSNAAISNPVANPAADITYTVTVTDANGCTNTATLTITVTSTVVANAGADVSLCSGSSATLNASGGSTYSWSPSTGLSNPNIANPITNPASPITYTVVVSSGNCSSVDMVSVNVNPLPVPNISSQSDVSCFGDYDGSATVTVSSGTNPITYFWPSMLASSPTVSGLFAGNYIVVVTDANGCSATASASIAEPSALSSTISSVNAGCGMSNGTATVSPLGGTTPYTYLWNNGGNALQNSNLLPQNYTVTITDANGCTLTNTISVSENPPPTASVSGPAVICAGDNVLLSATGGLNYAWSTGAVTSSITVSPTSTTSYTVTVTNDNCSDTATVSVNVNPLPTTSIGSDTTIIQSQSIVLNASGGISYQWLPLTDLSCSDCQSPTVTPQVTTSYVCIVTNEYGCTATDTVTIFVIPLECPEPYLPNAFSPNNDGENDFLKIYIKAPACLLEMKLTIFDRWGEKIYETTDPAFEWNGIYNKGILKGTYVAGTEVFVYRLTATTYPDIRLKKTGNISLLR